jgi:hypothetical protein
MQRGVHGTEWLDEQQVGPVLASHQLLYTGYLGVGE